MPTTIAIGISRTLARVTREARRIIDQHEDEVGYFE